METWPITYVYTRSDLFIAYGVSFLAALLCTMVGIRAYFVNDASYQNMFSTYIRATTGAGLGSYIEHTDAGHDPLPKALAKARFDMSHGQSEKNDKLLSQNSEDESLARRQASAAPARTW